MSDFPLQIDVSVIIMRGDKVLLMQRPEHDRNFPLHWGIPGGGFEPQDESLEAAGQREVYEEVGVTIKGLRLYANNFLRERNIIFVIFIAEYDSGEINIDPNEVAQAGWFGLADIEGRQFTPVTEGLIRRALA